MCLCSPGRQARTPLPPEPPPTTPPTCVAPIASPYPPGQKPTRWAITRQTTTKWAKAGQSRRLLTRSPGRFVLVRLHRRRQRADPFDLDRHDVAGLEVLVALGAGAGRRPRRDQVAGEQRHVLGDVGDL